MNDFTKEELINLLNCCKAAYISGEINPQTPSLLKVRIQSMIDNYCAHEDDGICYYNMPQCKCKKCGEFYR